MDTFDPDKGSGRPGSFRWHSHWVEQCTTTKELGHYLIAVTGKDFSIESLKAIALSQIKEYLDGKG